MLLARQKTAGILDVFQGFLTQPAAILAAKMRAEAIGTASKAALERGKEGKQEFFTRILDAMAKITGGVHYVS